MPTLDTLDQISAQIEVRILEFNTLVRILRSKRFKELPTEKYYTRFHIYESRQFELVRQIDELKANAPGSVTIWDGALK